MNALGGITPGGFPSANGPPPGLSVPPGLGRGPPPPMQVAFMNQGMGMNGPSPGNMRGSMQIPTTSSAQNGGPMYPDYMMGR